MMEAEAKGTVGVGGVAEVQEAMPVLPLRTTVGPMDPSVVTQANSAPDVRNDIQKKWPPQTSWEDAQTNGNAMEHEGMTLQVSIN